MILERTRRTPPPIEDSFLTSTPCQRSSTDSPQIVLKTALTQTLLSVGLYAEAKLYLSRALLPHPQESSSKTTYIQRKKNPFLQVHGDLKHNMCSVLEGGLGEWVGSWVSVWGGTRHHKGWGVSVWLPCHHKACGFQPCLHPRPTKQQWERKQTCTQADTHTHTQTCTAFRGSGAPDVLGFLFDASTAGRVCGCGLSVSGSCERQKLG